MPNDRYSNLYSKINDALSDSKKSDMLLACMKRGRDTRAVALESLPGGAAFCDDVRKAKERCIENHDELKKRFIENVEKRGVTVYEAKTGPDAIKYCLDIARKRGAKNIAKSKSLTTEEIEFNKPFIKDGINVVETDLGELIIQLVNEKPFHLVFPSVHKMAPEVAKIFSKATGDKVEDDIPSIMKVVRKYLRPIFLNAEIGITGANIGIAETGGICIETNEGNARLVSSIGSCHICVVGMEKIVDSIEDAMLMVLAHPVSASGQLPTTYVTWMHGRSPMGDGGETPRESHIVILDNGRTEMRDDPEPVMKESLYCIRCGACTNICPTFGILGGHKFGYLYPGPMGVGWTAGVHGLEKAGDFAQFCISCGLCKDICPAKIDMPMIIAEVKHRDAQKNGYPKVNKVMMGADKAAKLGSATVPFSNMAITNKAIRKVMEKTVGLSADRKLPPFAGTTFMQHFNKRTSKVTDPSREVAFFVDVFANYNDPALGLAAVDALEELGCKVIVPPQEVSGYPYIAYGDMDKARKTAASNVEKLVPYARKGIDVVAIEPTASSSLVECYPVLLRQSEDARLLAEKTFELFEYLIRIEDETGKTPSGKLAKMFVGKKFGFHCACHQRPLGSGKGAMEWLRRRGADVQLIETGTCCGMGGTFGLKAGPLGHKLSSRVGEKLFTLFKEAAVGAIVTESSVCSIQLAEGTGLPVYHPLKLLVAGGK